MKAKWKKMFVWSSLGSVMLGTAIALARRTRRAQVPPLEMRAVPDGSSRISVWTEHFQVECEDGTALVQDRYLFQATPFKVWSLLESQGVDLGAGPVSWRIYHVTHLRFHETAPAATANEQMQLQDRFYGTISVVEPASGRLIRDEIGRGVTLAIRKCSVGGASNGVETGDIHQSAAPILNYRFEYAAVEKRV